MKSFLVFLLILTPLYLIRLWREPVYNLPTDQPIRFQGRITSQPYTKDSHQVIKMGPILVITDRFPKYFYGQTIRVNSSLKFGVTGQFKRDYVAYFPAIETIHPSGDGSWAGRLGKLKTRLEKQFAGYLPEPLAGLFSGIVLGSKSGLPEIFSQNLRETGTIHAVVASGQNIGLLTYLLMAAFSIFWGRKGAVLAASGVVWLYVLLTGAEAPVVRAAVMAELVFAARWLGKEAAAGRCLVLAGGVMLLVQPLLLFDLGFQLSFAATAGLLWLTPLLERFIKSRSFAAEAVRSTLAAQVAVTPLLLANFGEISVLSPVVNSLVVWTTPLIMTIGMLGGLAGLVSPLIGQAAAWIAWPLLAYFAGVVELFARIPWASVKVGQMSTLWVFGYYLLLWLIVLKPKAGPAVRYLLKKPIKITLPEGTPVRVTR